MISEFSKNKKYDSTSNTTLDIFSQVKIILFLFHFPNTYQQFAEKYSIYQEHHLPLSVPLGLSFAMVIVRNPSVLDHE